MLNLHPLECTIKDNDHIPDLLLIKYWGIISCKYIISSETKSMRRFNKWKAFKEYKGGGYKSFYTQNCNGTPLLE